MIGADQVGAAAERIAGRIRRTPVLEPGSRLTGSEVVLKLELLQHTGSFKPRGAFNRLLTADVPETGVVAASGGNFGLAVAHAAAELEVEAQIFVPKASPPAKLARFSSYPARVEVTGDYYDDSLARSREVAATTGALELHAFDDEHIVAGQGTCAMELDEQAPLLDTVIVACGGGGLIAGACAWFGDRVRIVCVEPKRCPTLSAALTVKEPVEVDVSGLASDSLGARRIGDVPFELLSRYVDDSILIEDEEIAEAQRALFAETRLVAEPGGAAALAALTSGAYVPEAGERVAVLVCGSNADPQSVT